MIIELNAPTEPKPSEAPTKATAEKNTRQAILDAAQARLARLGADGLRLQDIARDVGISHPTILHHFGSRDGLIVALVKHIGEAFVTEIIRRIHIGTASLSADMTKVGLAFDLLAHKSFGDLLGWAYRQRPADITPVTENLFNMAFESMIQFKSQRDGVPPDEAWRTELVYSMRLALMVAAGESLIGKPISFSHGNYDDFQLWIGNLIAARVDI